MHDQTRIQYESRIQNLLELCARLRVERWRWTVRVAAIVAVVPFLLQIAVGLYLGLTQPPPPPGFGNVGFAIMLGSVMTGGIFAVIGAAIGFVIDVALLPFRSKSPPHQKVM